MNTATTTTTAAVNTVTTSRTDIAQRLHDLLLHEMGENIDVALLLGPPEYARAVLSLCRTCGSAELVRLGEQFARISVEAARVERGAASIRRMPGAPAH